VINLNSSKYFTKDEHVDHDGDSEERILTNVVRGDGVGTPKEDL